MHDQVSQVTVDLDVIFCGWTEGSFVMKIIGNTCDCFKQTIIIVFNVTCSCKTVLKMRQWFVSNWLSSQRRNKKSTQVGSVSSSQIQSILLCRENNNSNLHLMVGIKCIHSTRRRHHELCLVIEKWWWFSTVINFYWRKKKKRSKVWSNKSLKISRFLFFIFCCFWAVSIIRGGLLNGASIQTAVHMASHHNHNNLTANKFSPTKNSQTPR